MRCFYFGCWKQAGHYLHAPGGRGVYGDERVRIENYLRGSVGLDGTLAPRKRWERPGDPGGLCWTGFTENREERVKLQYRSDEYPQGQFLRHELDNGFTAIQWWDRNQGDRRGACNSTILLEGIHTTEEMLAALAQHFPHVLANLTAAGITLVEVHRPMAPP